MGKKGRKTRWRKLPIPIGPQGGEEGDENGVGGGGMEKGNNYSEDHHHAPSPPSHHHNHHHHHHNHTRVTFNEDEYTKITTPRQDMLFKKGYLSKKRSTNITQPPQDVADSQSAQSADSVESEQYICEEPVPQYVYPPPTGYIDPTGVYFLNSNTYEVYDPYTGSNVTVIVGPPAYNGGQPVLAAVPCQPVPLQHVEWFNPLPPPTSPQPRKKLSSTDSQNCSALSSESTCPPSSPQEPIEDVSGMMYPPQYMYPYMFGAPLYNMNGVSVQGVVPQGGVGSPADVKQRRKKRRRRRRGGVTDEGSESSCEEVLSCEAGVESVSGASSDGGPGSTCSKTNSDSGIQTDVPPVNSGSNSPQLEEGEQEVKVVSRPEPSVEANEIEERVLTMNDTVSESRTEKSEEIVNDFPVKEAPVEAVLTMVVESPRSLAKTGSEELTKVSTNAVDRLASSLAESVIGSAKKVLSSKRPSLPITEAVTKWLANGGGESLTLPSPKRRVTGESEEDEGIEEEEDEEELDEEEEDDGNLVLAGQKNVVGNPFPAPSLSGSGTRVASCSDDCSSIVSSAGEWDMYDLSSDAKAPAAFYHHQHSSNSYNSNHSNHQHHLPPSLHHHHPPLLTATAVHFPHHPGPFPCGICCLIQ